jgi:hypothetical protein
MLASVQVQNLLSSYLLFKNVKVKIFKSVILSVVCIDAKFSFWGGTGI